MEEKVLPATSARKDWDATMFVLGSFIGFILLLMDYHKITVNFPCASGSSLPFSH